MTGAWKHPKPQAVAPKNWAWSDVDILAILWRSEGMGHTAAQIALIYGTTASAIKGVLRRAKNPEGARMVGLLARHQGRIARQLGGAA